MLGSSQSSQWRTYFERDFPDIELYSRIYKDLLQHPQLPTEEFQTAASVARHLLSLEYEVQTGVGGHGVIGVLKNGHGKVVLLRSELDALPIQEMTGLDYASTVQQVDADGVVKWVMHG